MFADPQSITFNSVAKSLVAIGRGETQSTYKLKSTDAEYLLTLAHQFKARNRVIARLQRTAVVADIISPSDNIVASATVTLTIDFPNNGFSLAEVQDLGTALVDWATEANLLKLVGGET